MEIKSFKYLKISILIAFASFVTLLFFSTKIKQSIFRDENINPYELVVSESNSVWSYEIFYNNNILIKQEYIPAVKGMQRFSSKRDAKKTGILMIQKLKNKKIPSITIKELKINDISFKI